jgi:hypothetical protein
MPAAPAVGDPPEEGEAPAQVASCAMNTLNPARRLGAPLAALAIAFAVAGSARAADSAPEYHGLSDPALVVRWSQLAEDNAFAIDPELKDPFPNMRGWTMMYLAMHDALNAIVPRYRQYAFFRSDPSANPLTAAAQAAHDVLALVNPARRADIDAELDYWLSQVPEGEGKSRGIALGRASAAAIVQARADDGMLTPGQYAPQDPPGPGDYRFVPPLEFVYRPTFGDALPFALRSVAEFLPGPPPALSSREYADAVEEVKAYGRRASEVRSPDQTRFGAWWLEFNEIQWGRIMRQLAAARRLDLVDAARMFALVNVANTDATVAVWQAKQRYDFWRPIHAIRLAGADGNPRTIADPEWEGEHVVPPLQEYPSAHAIQCHAIARTLQSVLGTDRVRFATRSTTALPDAPVRAFDRLSAAAEECGVSRIVVGYHYRFSVEAGARMGERIGRRVTQTQLLRRCPVRQPE